MTRLETIAWLERKGFVAKRSIAPNLFYHPAKPERRYRITDLGLRREVRTPSGSWVRVASAYYKNLSLADGDKLSGMSRKGM